MSCCSCPTCTFWIACVKPGLGSMLRIKNSVRVNGPAGSQATPHESLAFAGLAAAVEIRIV